jgi:hypothetical protein
MRCVWNALENWSDTAGSVTLLDITPSPLNGFSPRKMPPTFKISLLSDYSAVQKSVAVKLARLLSVHHYKLLF